MNVVLSKLITGTISIKNILVDWWVRPLWMRWPFVSRQRELFLKKQLWDRKHINQYAYRVKDKLRGFKYIIRVDYNKIYEANRKPFTCNIQAEFQQAYMFPSRAIGDHTHILIVRGCDVDGDFEYNDFGGDVVFAATNNEEDATMIALKYT